MCSIIVMSGVEVPNDTGDNNNKRQATSPAMGSEDVIKRRNVLSKLDIDNIDVPGLPTDAATTALAENLCDDALKTLPEGKGRQDDYSTEPDLNRKVDLLTCKMDKVLEYLVMQKERSDARDQINSSKFKLLEKSHNNVIDKLGHVDLDLEECRSKIEHNAINIESNEDSLNAVQTQLRLLKASDREKSSQIKDLQNKMKSYDKALRETQGSVLDIGQEVRDRNLMISGVGEQKDEDTLGVVIDELNKILKQALAQNKVDPKKTQRRPKFRTLVVNDIDNAYRIGKPLKGKNRPRNISVSFTVGYKKHMVISAKHFMRDSPKGFYLGEDLRPEARAHRSNLKQIAAGAKSLGLETKISGNKLTIDTEVYTPEELPAVDEDIISASKQQKSVKGGIAFKGDRSIFSNFFPASFVIEDYEYANVEQYFQFTKATECGYDRLARKVLLKDNPWYCKTMGGRATVNNNWKSMRLRTLYKGIFAKFDQNGPLKQVLMDTEGLNLYEATTDLYWGCGIDIDSDKWDSGEWHGENVCGKILVKVREEFLRESDLGRSTEDTLMDIVTSMNSTTELLADSGAEKSNSPLVNTDVPADYEEELEHDNSTANPPVNTNLTCSTPKLTRVEPQVTPSRGKGRGASKNPLTESSDKRNRFPPNSEKLSKDDKLFLSLGSMKTLNNNNRKVQHRDNHQFKNKTSGGPSSIQNKTNRKQRNNNGRNSHNLSPKQKQAIAQIGIEPSSGFVQSIIAAKGNKV